MIPHMSGVGGFKRTCKGLFTELANRLPEPDPKSPAHAAALRCRQSITPDLVLDLAPIDLPENAAGTLGDRTLVDMKALTPWEAYSEFTSAAFSYSVEKRQKQVSPACPAAAKSLDVEIDSQPGLPGPVESELSTYNS